MEEAKKMLLSAYEKHKGKLGKLWQYTLQDPKSARISEKNRKQGDAEILKKNHNDKIHKTNFELYCKSAAFAPCNSQVLGITYSSLATFLLHINNYEGCMQNVEKAMSLHVENKTKINLLCLKVECMKHLGITGYENFLEQAQVLLVEFLHNSQLVEMVKHATTLPFNDKVHTKNNDETLYLPVTNNVFDKISVQHDKEYGRHLVATKKYKPGEVIFTEKLFASALRTENQYTNCHHCLKICWFVIPCKYCNWAIFCSEDCYSRCWSQYHDIECSLVSFLNSIDMIWPTAHLSIKIFIKALKSAASIFNLKTELDHVDQMSTNCYNDLYNQANFNSDSIKSIYSLESKILTGTEQEKVSEFTLNFLIGLIKHTKLIEDIDTSKIDSLMNKDLLFLGSLFIKITTVIMNNGFQLSSIFGMEEVAKNIAEDVRGIGLAPLASLINHNCNPNAKLCFTEDGKVIVFAALPIKKKSQIFISYCKDYYNARLEDRQAMLNYNFVCRCQACVEAWPPVLLDFGIIQEIMSRKTDPDKTMFRVMEQEFLHSIDPERKLLLSGSTVLQATDAYCNNLKEKVENLSKKVIAASHHIEKPSMILGLFLEGLYRSITNLYNGLKPQLFKKCKKLQN